jgi:ferredoxin
MPAVVYADKCDGCEICVDECPSQAIKMKGKLAVVDTEECTGCETCVDICPSEAVWVVRDK